MSEPFIAEIRIVSFSFAPKGWAACNGQLLPIAQNQALFSILGTTYGGNGIQNFALPNLQGRVPMHPGVKVLGQAGGEQNHTLSAGEIPTHTHTANAATAGGSPTATPTNAVWGTDSRSAGYRSGKDTTLNAASVGTVGGGQPHPNMQPYLVLNFVIALTGIFPSRN